MKTAVRQTAMVSLSALKNAPHNPKERIERVRLTELMHSMVKNGLIYPVVITPDNEIIDGHRRVAAAKFLKWESIECFIQTGSADTLFADINSTPLRLGGRAPLSIYLKNPKAVGGRRLRELQEAEKLLGRRLLVRICEAGLSTRIVRLAKSIARYCDKANKQFAVAAADWLITHRIVDQVYAAMHCGVSPNVIEKSILKDEPLTFVTRPAELNGEKK